MQRKARIYFHLLSLECLAEQEAALDTRVPCDAQRDKEETSTQVQGRQEDWQDGVGLVTPKVDGGQDRHNVQK